MLGLPLHLSGKIYIKKCSVWFIVIFKALIVLLLYQNIINVYLILTSKFLLKTNQI